MEGNQYFFEQIRKGCIQTVFDMLKIRSNLANIIQNGTNLSPILIACIHIQDSYASLIIRQLLQLEADPSHEDNNGQNALFPVAAKGKIQCFEILLSAHLAIQKTDCIGQTSLFGAAENNQIAIFQYLPTINGDILNKPDKLTGQTPIFYAAMNGHQQLCKLLVLKGANPNFKDNSGQTPKSYAQLYSHYRLQAYLCSLNSMNEISPIAEELERPCEKQWYHLCQLTLKGQKRYLNQSELIDFGRSFQKIGSLLNNPELIHETKLSEDCGQDWRKIGIKIVNQLYWLKNSYWFKQLSPKFAESLKQLRLNPRSIDLNTIKLKLQHNCYRNQMEFTRDMNLIWDISEHVSTKNDYAYRYAQQLKKKFYQIANEEGFYAFGP